MNNADTLTAIMESAVAKRVFPGAVLLVRTTRTVVYYRAFGHLALTADSEPATTETLYDLASLTKPLATASAILLLIQAGQLALETRVGALLKEMEGSPAGDSTVLHLLNHSSGLPAWRPFYERIVDQDRTQPGFLGSDSAKRQVLELIGQQERLHPPGSRSLYSDLGFILLGAIVERVSGSSLDVFCRERIYEPAGATPLGFLPVCRREGRAWCDRRRVAPTEDIQWRGGVVSATVHDENAYAMGGVAGHAGLFGTAGAVLAAAGSWLDAYQGRGSLFRADLVRQFVSRQRGIPESSWGLGWDTPSPPSSSGTRFSPESFGHLGYTGTSLWVDPTRELEVVLLTNRVHPTSRNDAIREFRPVLHDAIYQEFLD